MALFSFRRFLLLVLMALTASAGAQQLHVNAWKGGEAVAGATVILDGAPAGETGSNGVFRSDELSPGQHSAAVEIGGQAFRFEFAAGEGEAAVFSVAIPAQGEPARSLKVVDSGARAEIEQGVVSGRITSLETGGAIADARVSVVGTQYATTTGADGSFSLRVPRGRHTLRIAHPEYGNKQVSGVLAVPGLAATVEQQLSVAGASGQIEEVVATARYIPDTASQQERQSGAVLSVIGSEQIARFGDSDAAAALKRVSGLTVEEGRFAVVRGLQGRYNTTTFNGATIPSTHPTKSTVPLDMFPSMVLDTVQVQKSFTPDMPGESTGGAITLSSKEYPAQPKHKVSLSVGYNDVVTGEDVVHQQESTDVLGFGDDSRDLPTSVDLASDEGRRGFEAFTPETRERLGESFERTYDVVEEQATPDISLGLSSGNSITRGQNEYGYLVGLKYKNEWELQDGVENTFDPNLDPATQFDYEKSKNTIDLGGMVSLGASLGSNHEFTSNTLALRHSYASTKRQEGFNTEDDREPQLRVEHEWVERQILAQQFLGQHVVPALNNAQFNWRFTLSSADRVMPDRRSFTYEGEGPNNALQLSDSTVERRFDDMEDDTLEYGLDYTQPLGEIWDVTTDVKTGFNISSRERDSEVSRFGFRWQGEVAEEDQVSQNPNVDEVLSPENIRPDGYVIQNQTQRAGTGSTFMDSYTADWDQTDVYVRTDFDYNGKFKVVTGARVEDSDQQVTAGNEEAELDKTDVLPSFNVTWFAREDLQFRLAYSETVSRPDFTELAPSAIIDPEFGFPVVGNPDLKRTQIDNLDLRAEWYLSNTESVSLALFDKDFTNPIERTVTRGSGSASDARTYINADSASNQGIELSFRKEFSLGGAEQHSFFVQGNYAYIDSEIDLGQSANEGDNEDRPLQGQSDNIVNAQLGYDHLATAQKATLMVNWFSERIALVGEGNKPPVEEESFAAVKLNYEKGFGDNLTVEASIENLLDETREFTQGGKVWRRYDPGRTFEVGFSYEF